MRAKKFGVTDLSVDAKRAVRAERFASNSATSITSSTVVRLLFLKLKKGF